MRKFQFTDSQIIAILKQAEAGTPVSELCREHGITSATFCKWQPTYGGMDAAMVSRMKEPEEENRWLKMMYAEAQMSADITKEALLKSGEAMSASRCGPMGGDRQRPKYRRPWADLSIGKTYR